MNTDDKIRAILRLEAETVEPSPAGWDAIKSGVAARSRRLWWVRGGALAGATLTVAAVAVLAGGGASRQSIEPRPASPGPTAPPSAGPTTAPPVMPSPSAPPTVTYADAEPLGTIWPLTTGRELREWQADPETYPALRERQSSAQAFLRGYAGVTEEGLAYTHSGDPADPQVGVGRWESQSSAIMITELTVVGFGPGGGAPYLVTRATSDYVAITRPDARASVDSPLAAHGTFTGVDPSVTLSLRADGPGTAPDVLAETRPTYGPPNDWDASLSFTTTARTGGLLATIGYGRERVAGIAAVPLTFGAKAAAPPADAFVAARDGRAALVSAGSGEVLRWLTEDGPGTASDPAIDEDGRRVVYVHSAGGCASEIRSVPIAGGRPTTLVPSGGKALTRPSRRGGNLAYLRTPCAGTGGRPEVVLDSSGHVTVEPVDGDVVGDIVVGLRFALYVTVKDGRTTLHSPDLYGELADTNAEPPGGCEWLAVTAGAASGGREDMVAAARCGSSGTTVLYRLDAEGRNATEIGRAGTLLVTTMDYDRARKRLLLGVLGRTAEPEVYEYGPTPRRVPGLGQRPTW